MFLELLPFLAARLVASDWATPAGPRDGNEGASFLYPLDPLVAHG
jgi:hypothetical protein